MPIPAAQFNDFKVFADDTVNYREKECTKYLEYAVDILLPQTPITTISLNQEQRSPYGRSDYIVVADLKSATGQSERFMYFWELKAPQAFLVEIDDAATRYRPTKELVKAETQLLHYVKQAAGDEDLKARWNIRYAENVRAGGIIIGRDERIFRPSAGANHDAASHSFRIRHHSIYEKCQIQVITWDRILDFVKPIPAPAV